MNERKTSKTKDIVLAGMFTAVLAVLSQISIPLPSGVPITLQTFAAALCGAVLGWKLGTISTLVYVLLGALGAPIFAGMQGGVGILFGKTGGFIWGFITMALLCGLGIKMKSKVVGCLFGLLGLATTHLFGVIGFSILTNTNLVQSFILVSVPYLLKDIISVIGAYCIAIILRKQLFAANLIQVPSK